MAVPTVPADDFLDKTQTMEEFGNRFVEARITQALVGPMRLRHPTLVQAQCIPLALQGRDVLIKARTGTGKTLAFVVPMLDLILKREAGGRVSGGRALVIAPTRELSNQIAKVIGDVMYYCPDSVVVANTAAPEFRGQTHRAYDANVILGTPQSLLSFLTTASRPSLSLDRRMSTGRLTAELSMVIVDEADLIVGFGYKDDMEKLRNLFPSSKIYQTIMCSATLNPEVNALKALLLHKPAIIKLEGGSVPLSELRLTEYYLGNVPRADKWLVTYSLFKLNIIPMKCLVFVGTVHRAYALRLFLHQFGISCTVLSPILPFASRQTVINAFNQGFVEILIATGEQDAEAEEGSSEAPVPLDGPIEADDESDDGTVFDEVIQHYSDSEDDDADDVKSDEEESKNHKRSKKRDRRKTPSDDEEFHAHRGLDLKGVNCVLSIDAPLGRTSYVHRIGRTARAGSSGVALTFVELGNEAEVTLMADLVRTRRNPVSKSDSSIKPLGLKLSDLECFRYRVDDVKRRVTRKAVARMMVRTLQQEALNSKRLREHFDENPRDESALKAALKAQEGMRKTRSLAHVPDYLIPGNTTRRIVTPVQAAVRELYVDRGGAPFGTHGGRASKTDVQRYRRWQLIRLRRMALSKEDILAKNPDTDKDTPFALARIDKRSIRQAQKGMRPSKRKGLNAKLKTHLPFQARRLVTKMRRRKRRGGGLNVHPLGRF